MKKILENNDIKVFECPHCHAGSITINKNSKHKYGDCDMCGATYIDYVPLPHQVDVHRSKAIFKLLIGG